MADLRDINERARELTTQGVSRRRMDAILKSEYGRSVGHQVHAKIYSQRIESLVKQKAIPKSEVKQFKTRRQEHYSHFIDAHFLHSEAVEFSKLKNLNYKELRIMVGERKMLWRSFVARADRKGLPASKTQSEWKKTVVRWYLRKGYVTGKITNPNVKRTKRTKTAQPSPWAWFDKVKDKLPPEEQSETPRKKARKRQPRVTKNKIKIQSQLNKLHKDHKEATGERKKQIAEQISELQSKMRGRYEDKL